MNELIKLSPFRSFEIHLLIFEVRFLLLLSYSECCIVNPHGEIMKCYGPHVLCPKERNSFVHNRRNTMVSE